MKIGFLFNHDAGHQAFHLLPIINAYAALRPDDEIRAYVGGDAMLEAVNAGLTPGRGQIALVDLGLPPILGSIARLLDVAMPASRWTRLRCNAKKFCDLDALVAPERTCLLLKDIVGPSLKFIHCRHGAGDRNIGFHPSFSRFDLLLLQGEKYVRRLRKTGGLSGNSYALVGYPKFDMAALKAPKMKFFDNSNPTVVYNPHFSPEMSSWYGFGVQVLDWFLENPDVNLIVAPHVMMFRRHLHISPDTHRIAWRRDIEERFRQAANILIDTNSSRLFDMSYMRAADLYLGDISSQVMEFLLEPRPCVFLNPRKHRWAGDDNFAAWRLGTVVEREEDIGPAIRGALANPHAFAEAQRSHFADTFDLTDEPSSVRAVRAIGDFLDRKSVQQEGARPETPGGWLVESGAQLN